MFPSSPVYYRVLEGDVSPENVTGFVIACLQDFDEYDYDHSRYATQETFETEELAQAWIDKQELRILRTIMKLGYRRE